jgi:23S rRNA (uridine2552-2'-O)-methyltransferase
MGKKNSLWLQKHRKDHYFKLAKERGYRSRSAFKLLQISRNCGLLKQGKKIVDLGASPGGWIQVARDFVGDDGFILGIDKKPLNPFFRYENIETLEMDVNDDCIFDTILEKAHGKVDVVISDLAPSVSGARSLDNFRQIDLAERALEIAKKLLKKNGNFLVKVFDSPESQDFFKKVKRSFKKAKQIKPDASARKSSEIFFIGINLQPSHIINQLENEFIKLK